MTEKEDAPKKPLVKEPVVMPSAIVEFSESGKKNNQQKERKS